MLAACLSAPAVAKPTGYNLVCSNCHDGGARRRHHPDRVGHANQRQPCRLLRHHQWQGRVPAGRRGRHAPDRRLRRGSSRVTHTMPKTSTTGDNVFQVRWKAPAQMGSVDFDVYAVSATGKISPTTNMVFPEDDGMGHRRLGFSFGCAGSSFWPDTDGDGFGATDPDGPTQLCQQMKGFAVTSDDCNDGDAAINPKATEVCNQGDDDCDAKVDEDLPPGPLYKDTDNDGYRAPPAATM